MDWSQSGIQIIASIIGSGLIATALTGLVSEINRLHIDISVQEDLISPDDYVSNFTTTFINTGKTSASIVRLTLNYPDAEIKNYYMDQESENTSLVISSKNAHILAAYIPRFTSGAVNRITTTLLGDWDADDLYNTEFQNPSSITTSSITATYDEGSDIYPPKGYRYAIQVFLIYAVLAALAFAIALRYKEIHGLIEKTIRKRNRTKFIFQVFQDILEADNLFTRNARSIKCITAEKWKSYPPEYKFQIFTNLKEYLTMDSFYREIENRNSRILGKDISEHDVIDVNKECAQLAHKALTNINWIKFGLKKINLDLILAVPAGMKMCPYCNLDLFKSEGLSHYSAVFVSIIALKYKYVIIQNLFA